MPCAVCHAHEPGEDCGASARSDCPYRSRTSQWRIAHALGMLEIYRLLPARSLGGCVHIVVDDPNPEQHHADYCVEVALTSGWDGDDLGRGRREELYPADLLMAQTIAALSPGERTRIQEES